MGSPNSSVQNSPAPTPQGAKLAQPPLAPPSAFARAAAAIHHEAPVQHGAGDMSRAISYNSGLTEYVNKMKISEAGTPAAPAPLSVGSGTVPGGAVNSKRSKLSNDSVISSSSSLSAMSVASARSAAAPMQISSPVASSSPVAMPAGHPHGPFAAAAAAAAVAPAAKVPVAAPQAMTGHHAPPLMAAHQPGTPVNQHAYQSNLDRLLEAARFCQLPQSGRPVQPMPADPLSNPHLGPTIPLVMSPGLPPRMQRQQWRLSDYTLGDKLYTGYASTVYKAVCRASGEVVVLKIYHLLSVCDLYKYQIYREVKVHSSLSHENIVHLYAAFQVGEARVRRCAIGRGKPWQHQQLCAGLAGIWVGMQ
jgi:hypothetical protein